MELSRVTCHVERISDTLIYELKSNRKGITIHKKTQDFLQRPLILLVSREGLFSDKTPDKDFDKIRHVVEAFYMFAAQINKAHSDFAAQSNK